MSRIRRTPGQKIKIDRDVSISILRIEGTKVRLLVDAPSNCFIEKNIGLIPASKTMEEKRFEVHQQIEE